MDYLKIDRAYIVGWNFGAIIGLELASQQPDRVRALVAYGAYTNPKGLQAYLLDWFRSATLQVCAQIWITTTRPLSSTPDHLPVMLEKVRTLALTQPNITPDSLASIKAPTLILDTQEEDLLSIDHVKAMAKAMPQAKFILLPGYGHLAPSTKPCCVS